MKSLKYVVTFVMAALVLACTSLSVLAAPASLPATVTSSNNNLVVITNPPSFTSTTQKGVVFCGYGEPGTVITFYEYDSVTATYKPVMSNNAPITVKVNASGVFWKKIDFNGGYHKVIIYAEKNGQQQAVRREINVLSVGSVDIFKEYSVIFR